MNTKGIALVATLALMVVIALLVFGTFFTTQIELWTTRNDTTSVQAFYAAEAGVQKYKAALFQQYVWQERNGSVPQTGGSTVCYSVFLEGGIDWNRNGTLDNDERFVSNTMTLATDEPVVDAQGRPVGRYTVELVRTSSPRIYTLISRGESGGARARVQATVLLETPSPLNVAIFAGSGQANKWLNGGATIRGGIYIVGDPRYPDQEVISSNGNFSLLNWYDLTNARDYGSLGNYVSEANRKANDLCASLRVQYGKISVGGSTQIGEPNNKVKGVFVGRGPQDITYITDNLKDCLRTRGVCTEAIGGFDLSDPPAFPKLDDPGGCGAGKTWRTCLREDAANGLRIVQGSPPSIIWPLLAVPKDPSSCLTAFTNTKVERDGSNTVELDGNTVDCSYTLPSGAKGGFKYTPGNPAATLEVYGTVLLEGFNLVLNKNTQYVASTGSAQNASLAVLAYGGRGGNLDINGTLLPNPTQGLFPQHVLGLVAEKDIYQRGQYVMAPVYAGGTFGRVRNYV
ncbi:pilus assembly PilX family protein [Thermus scotoductus]|uniref:pilus assembly PilX family protein n=1 Tax=Thermus scotoductus TaxID=37636 RepID=UPI001C12AE65|nr:pilus assembly PilX N-terminal domain-containing protein [Thermus scotoductus]